MKQVFDIFHVENPCFNTIFNFVTGGQKIEIMVTYYVNMNEIARKTYFHISA